MSNTLAKTLNSASFLVLSQLLQKSLGLISLLILARILVPEDFSVIAVTMMVIYFFDVLSSAGSEQYIIQSDSSDQATLNTAWTIDIISKTAIYSIAAMLAPVLASFFEQPALSLTVLVAGLILPINALKNPAVFLLKKNLTYQGIFVLTLVQKLAAFFTCIGIAWATKSFWALILADLVSSLVFCIGSYTLAKHKPRLALSRAGRQWHFSKWMLVKSVLGYIRSQIDTFFVAHFFNPSTLGRYHVGRDLAMLPIQALFAPAIEPLLASFKALSNDQTDTTDKHLNGALISIAIVLIPICLYLHFQAANLVAVLLGEKWVGTESILSYLIVLTFYLPFLLVMEAFLMANGKLRTIMIYDSVSLLFITIGMYLSSHLSIESFALLRGVLGLTSILIFYFCIKRQNIYSALIVLTGLSFFCTANAFIWMQLYSWIDILIPSTIFNLLIFGVGAMLVYLPMAIVFLLTFSKLETSFSLPLQVSVRYLNALPLPVALKSRIKEI